MDDMKTYVFVYENITNCYDCPLCYDYICCNLKSGIKLTDELPTGANNRPFNCPLKEVSVK